MNLKDMKIGQIVAKKAKRSKEESDEAKIEYWERETELMIKSVDKGLLSVKKTLKDLEKLSKLHKFEEAKKKAKFLTEAIKSVADNLESYENF